MALFGPGACVVWLLLALLAAPAFAHAALLSSTLRDGDRLADAPDMATFTFTEPVTLPRAAARLYDANAESLPGVGATAIGDTVIVALPNVPAGAYVLTLTVVSQDGHQVRTPVRFAIGDAPVLSDEATQVALQDTTRDPTQVLTVVLRAVTYVTALVAMGFVLLARRLLPCGLRRLAGRVVSRLALVGGVAAGLTAALRSWWLYAPASVTDLVATFTADGTRGFYLRAASLAALAAAARTRWFVFVTAALVVMAHVADGHQLTFGVPWLMLTADTVHLLAGSVWFGGVALLVWLGRHDRTQVADVTAQFSRIAAGVAAITVVSGVAMAVQLLDGPQALITTTYGRVLGSKLLVVAMIGVVALRVRASVRRGSFDSAMLRRRLWVDVGAFVTVLAVTATLVTVNPQGGGQTVLAGQRVAFGPHTLEVVVEPATAATHVVHAYIVADSGELAAIDGLTLAVTFLADDGVAIGPFPVALAWVSDGHFFAVTDVLTFAGTWEFSFTAATERFTVIETTVAVAVP